MRCAICRQGELRVLGSVGAIELMTCDQCRSVSTGSPVPRPEELYGAGYYDVSYLRYAVQRNRYLRRLLVHTLGETRSGSLLLDSGCGIGLALAVGRELGWAPVGVERAPAAIALARSRVPPVIQASVDRLPLKPGTVDAVMLLDVLAHVEAPAVVLQECSRVLAPGGRILIKTPFRPRWLYRICLYVPPRLATALLHLPHQRHSVSESGMRILLRRLGYTASSSRWEEAIPMRSQLRLDPRTIVMILLRTIIRLMTGRPSLVLIADEVSGLAGEPGEHDSWS